ncbi:hypothetical protein F511_44582 [Dorcoceras hygrometricum]|uniref:PLATZ transcription factor family protein n=1 Tax=Dorcoceras hygrometricum TaxID=472368 RepID=A0A2Z6ZXV0_9LAMI|nr:hypothetical protein F511_44582 [Dorcoceras hygrometricum]
MPVPPWLEKLLTTAFFTACPIHGATPRSECNLFCVDCSVDDAFCHYCRSSNHIDHRVIQIRKSSYHDVVRVSEIHKFLDIGGVQPYVINGARVLFLNERPQSRIGKTVSQVCEICKRGLLDACRFCSLGCKLVGIRREEDASFSIDGENKEVIERKSVSTSSSSSSKVEEELREASQQDIYPPTPPSSSRRRKGIPQRAPF